MVSVQDPVYLNALNARFRIAARHSRRVRFLRKAVPTAIAVSMLAVIGLSIFNPFRMLAKLPFEIGRINVSGTKITMESPRLAGFSSDGRPYELHARSALQDVTKPNFMELQELTGKIEMEDSSVVIINATRGLMNTKDQILDLHEEIILVSPAYEAHLTQARVDIAKGDVVSDKPVAVNFLSGTLNAKRLEITENGALLRFTGGVRMDLTMADEAAAPASPPAGSR